MHRDKKLGLALALMVIGIGTAFCFKQDLSKLSEGSFLEGAFTGGKTVEPVVKTKQPAANNYREDDEDESSASSLYGGIASSRDNSRNDDRDPFDFSSGRDDSSRDGDQQSYGTTARSQTATSRSQGTTARPVSQSHRSPRWNDDTALPPSPGATTSDRDQLASNSGQGRTGRARADRDYHIPDHNSAWDSPTSHDRSNSYGTSNLTAQDDTSRTREREYRSPFNNEASFTAYPELLGESSDRSSVSSQTRESVARSGSDNGRGSRTGSTRPRLDRSIVTVEDEFDPFGQAIDTTPSTQTESPQRHTQRERSWQTSTPEITQNQTQSQPRSQPLDEEAIAPLSADTLLIHEVRRAETLSGISARYLGSARKFMQIFEANRDVLKSPHDIRVGMKLRIPRPGSATQAARSTPQEMGARLDSRRVSQSWRSEEVESLPEPEPYQSNQDQTPSPYDSKRDVFVPVRRYPFGN